jgi:hypothetical protein
MSKPPMSAANRQRVIRAASQVNPKNAREAAILGGIVRSSIDMSAFDKQYVRHYVPQALARFRSNLSSWGASWVTESPPSDIEIAFMLKRFMHFYTPPKDAAA